jgi:hypothetical protein
MDKLTFNSLVTSIKDVDKTLLKQTSKAINVGLTLRNWLIGGYIAEYELHGEDRANYGDGLFSALADSLKDVSNCNRRQLYRYLRFYRLYPQIVGAVNPQFCQLFSANQKVGSVKPLLASQSEPSAQTGKISIDGKTIVSRLSFTHISQLLDIDDDTKRLFYEVECIRGGWSVRELKRQINSLYYERSGLSKDKAKLAELANLKFARLKTRRSWNTLWLEWTTTFLFQSICWNCPKKRTWKSSSKRRSRNLAGKVRTSAL